LSGPKKDRRAVLDHTRAHFGQIFMLYPDQEAMVPNWPPFDGNWPVAPPPK